MTHFIRLLFCCLSALIPFTAASMLRAEENPHGDVFKNRPVPAVVDFNRDVRPVLSEKCYHCHGPDEESRKADLRLDLRAEAVKERDGAFAVKPKDAEASEVMKRILSTDPDEVMPPPKEGHALTARETEIVKKWIAQGAEYAEHWAFVKPVRPAVPEVSGQNAEVRSPVDAFIAAKLAEQGLAMSREADKHTQIRRVALDLTGLPPSPEEVEAFVADTTEKAYERMVDAYLAKPAYGERWAKMWLDIARYADSAGYGSDPLRMNIWPYRDWVIGAFNRNLPYDQFTLEQMAGDLLPNATPEQVVATAFHRNTMTNTEGGTDDEEFRVAAVKDRIAVTMQAWMGLTMGCAQCHTHKFDPITQQEYYEFYAIFNQTADSDLGNEEPTLPMPTAQEQSKKKALEGRIAEQEARLKAPPAPEFAAELAAWEKDQLKPTTWTTPEIREMTSEKGVALKKEADNVIEAEGAESDTYTVRATTPQRGITAVRLEALPDESLPQRGPGRSGGGNFVLSEFTLSAASASGGGTKTARFVRLSLPGQGRMLHLAEVQVMSGGQNVALKGKASQSSTDYDGDAQRANDGNTSGDYFKSNSVTHTKVSENPWWEVDLGTELPLDEITVWNRTDGGTSKRTTGLIVTALDAKREPVFEQTLAEAPEPKTQVSLGGASRIAFRKVTADLEQPGYPAAHALDGKIETGWAIGGEYGKPHAAVFLAAKPFGENRGETVLTFMLNQSYGANHTLGRFRLSVTSDPNPRPALPGAIQSILAIPAPQRTPAQRAELEAFYRPQSKSYAQVTEAIAALKKELANLKPISVPVLQEVAAEKRRTTRFLNKGSFLDPGAEVKPALLKSYHAAPAESPSRITVARWLTSRENPLTARVMVNRLWAQLFGTGIVETEEDFGTQGTLPSHPELLDWLATEFMDKGWDIKGLLKTLVMSHTYRQASKATPEAMQKDSRNLFLSHYPRRRLDAEQVRDQALALSGLLSPKLGGPSVYPPQPDGLWRAAFNGQRSWETSKGEDRYRRGLYTFWRRTVPYPSMATFDAPSRENSTLRRVPTNTPLQAFVTLNDPAYVEMAQALGARIMREGGDTVASRVRHGLELCLARPATEDQVAALEQLYHQERENYQAKPDDAKKLSTSTTLPLEKAFPKDRDAAELAAWTAVANVLLNLDGVLTKG